MQKIFKIVKKKYCQNKAMISFETAKKMQKWQNDGHK